LHKVSGFSPRSLKYMRSFAEAWIEEPIVQQLAAQLPWGHHMVLLDRLKDQPAPERYLKAAVEHGWSRNVLVHHISTQLQERQGKALTNFSRTLPPEDSDLAEQILKDPYNFDFLTLASTAKERELERGLLTHLRDLLLELGRGFAFVGSQVPLVVDDHSFYVDLLFYHIRLHCYFVIELKTGSSSRSMRANWASISRRSMEPCGRLSTVRRSDSYFARAGAAPLLCNSLLHNWFSNTHPYIGRFLTQGMKPTGVLL
jgi:predicted nuclease of restriction endonuclease-like (RecB) superfamily